MPARRLLLPLAISLTAVGTLTGGMVSAADLRADERRERAAAAERRAAEQAQRELVAYREALTPVVTAVYDLVQPLQLAFADLDDGDVSAIDVLVDVAAHLSSPEGLDVVRKQLEQVTPPAAVRAQHEQLAAAVADHVDAARPVAALAASDDDTRYASVIAKADIELDEATRRWTAPLIPVYSGATAPPVPVEFGTEASRVPLSRTSYLRDVGNLCSAGIDSAVETDKGRGEPTLEEIRAGLRELANRLPKLVAVRAVPADEPRIRTGIRAPLERTQELVAGFEAAVAAARRGDAGGLRAARARITRGEVAAEKAAAGLLAYGSKVCALYLVGLEDDADVDRPEARTT